MSQGDTLMLRVDYLGLGPALTKRKKKREYTQSFPDSFMRARSKDINTVSVRVTECMQRSSVSHTHKSAADEDT